MIPLSAYLIFKEAHRALIMSIAVTLIALGVFGAIKADSPVRPSFEAAANSPDWRLGRRRRISDCPMDCMNRFSKKIQFACLKKTGA